MLIIVVVEQTTVITVLIRDKEVRTVLINQTTKRLNK